MIALAHKENPDERAGVAGERKTHPINELLQARLRMADPNDWRITALRRLLQGVDSLSRGLTGQPFFALRETAEILTELDGRTGDALIRALLEMKGGTTVRPHGLSHVPTAGPVVIGSTHPIGTFDFIAHAAALLDHRPDLKVVAGREAERFLGPDRIVAVDFDKRDKVLTARQTRAGMLAHLQAGGALLVFGSGRVPGQKGGLLVERPWRTGVTHVSEKAGALIVPASADMRNSRHFYRTRTLAKVLSGGNEEVGHRVATLRYGSELIAKLGGTYDVHYGPPLPPGTAPDVLKAAAEGLVPGLYVPVGWRV